MESQHSHRSNRNTIIKKIDAISTTHLKINFALNVVMLAIILSLLIFIPFIKITAKIPQGTDYETGQIYLNEYIENF